MKYILFSILYLSVSETSSAQTIQDSVSNTKKVTLTSPNKTTQTLKKLEKPEKVLVAPPQKEIRKED